MKQKKQKIFLGSEKDFPAINSPSWRKLVRQAIQQGTNIRVSSEPLGYNYERSREGRKYIAAREYLTSIVA